MSQIIPIILPKKKKKKEKPKKWILKIVCYTVRWDDNSVPATKAILIVWKWFSYLGQVNHNIKKTFQTSSCSLQQTHKRSGSTSWRGLEALKWTNDLIEHCLIAHGGRKHGSQGCRQLYSINPFLFLCQTFSSSWLR